MTAYDPRAIANLMLDEADRRGFKISNLALQKLLYFAHGIHLKRGNGPLVSGYFEAWQYGPVHPAVYRAFKQNGSEPIAIRAVKRDPLSGQTHELPKPDNIAISDLVSDVIRHFGPMSPGSLVDLSHAKDAPWSYVVNKSRTNVAFGMQILDNVIAEQFHHHMVSLNASPLSGEPPSDDTPIA